MLFILGLLCAIIQNQGSTCFLNDVLQVIRMFILNANIIPSSIKELSEISKYTITTKHLINVTGEKIVDNALSYRMLKYTIHMPCISYFNKNFQEMFKEVMI